MTWDGMMEYVPWSKPPTKKNSLILTLLFSVLSNPPPRAIRKRVCVSVSLVVGKLVPCV